VKGRIALVVPQEATGTRLDRFLASAIPEGPSRATLQRWIAAGRVAVGGREAKDAAAKVRAGARIEVEPEPPAPTQARAELGIDFDVLYMDAAIVVVNKPPGLVVHPARGHAGGTLVNGLLALGAFDREGMEEKDRPGIVHRLDKGTSGVMVVARTERARERLKTQFAAHTIEREYEAICVGDVKDRSRAKSAGADEIVFDTLHGRHPTERMRFTSRVRTGKRAVTRVRVLERLPGATHVVCELETGRTHQIRVHLSEAGTPILGDPLYGKPPKDPFVRHLADTLGHQALHARHLGFDHPESGERVRFDAPPPLDFTTALRALRLARGGSGSGA
jgi:23S rRNA pseudouridine1911/1915/1917 synthase